MKDCILSLQETTTYIFGTRFEGVLLLQHVDISEPITTLPTEIQSPNSNLSNLPHRTGPPPEERSNVVSQLFAYDRDDPKDHFTTEIMDSDKGSDYIPNFTFVPPSPPPSVTNLHTPAFRPATAMSQSSVGHNDLNCS